jgi:hypothetical protein
MILQPARHTVLLQGHKSSIYILTAFITDRLHNEELHNLYSSPSIIRIINWRRMRWAGHVARMEGKEECV